MAHIIFLPLNEILELVVPHAAIEYLFDFILLVTINNHRWWRRVMSMAWNRVREC
jgi:hypothetical protein